MVGFLLSMSVLVAAPAAKVSKVPAPPVVVPVVVDSSHSKGSDSTLVHPEEKDPCDSVKYDTLTQFCVEAVVHARCHGSVFDPSIDTCLNGVVVPQQVADPVIFPSAGQWTAPLAVTITSATAGAEVRYTLDGSQPTASSLRYEGPLSLDRFATVRAMALKSGMTPSGAVASTLVAHGKLTDSRDGQVYRTIRLGKQNWMAQNLNFAGERLGACPGTEGEDDPGPEAACTVSGRLYTWAEAMMLPKFERKAYGKLVGKHRGICPEGWHVPDDEDWSTFFAAVLSEVVTNDKEIEPAMRSTMGWVRGKGKDRFGFGAMPVGYRQANDDFVNSGFAALFWSAAEAGEREATFRSVGVGALDKGQGPKALGLSVRCVSDNP
ncbi:MAG: hypothetical protein RL318_2875 [Fibrobacterota bacterium]|jgi:uncharacterized protein (TIGR02145 family)